METYRNTKHDVSNTKNSHKRSFYLKRENTDRYPSWKQLKSPQKRCISSYSIPEVRQITILKKVYEDTNIQHETQKASPETTTETAEEAVNETIFYPEFTNLRLTGNDGLTRAARLRTSGGIATRPIVKLYPLEVQCDDN
ncbi:hypothetical protein DPMN_165238 [Dreissena polymorpha]|uniref:Uncharacterized protein n=1 Tax=Dreissena polymorpha TaxID=45954 RepID=A0A9D4IWD5_DREPO|nr:hypothetical protein DPMN_165238 [Dreissena polymorpha]